MRQAFVSATMTLAVFLLLGSSASAQGEAGVWTAETAAIMAQKVDNSSKLSLIAYVRGLNDGMYLPVILEANEELREAEPSAWWSCIEGTNATVVQMEAMFRKALKEHPEDWNTDAVAFFFSRVVFPLCEQLPGMPEEDDPDAQPTEPKK